MARTYTQKRRAEQQSETRQRIVDAAVDLHGSIGPGLTTISMIAEHAGVQRHTVYAHFPDERSLYLACSGEVAERDPLPDAADWKGIDARHELLQTGLIALYGWFERNEKIVACVLRDGEFHALTREVQELRFGPGMIAIEDVLGAKLGAKQRAALKLALSFYTWRTLVREAGLRPDAAVEAMVHAIEDAGAGESPPPPIRAKARVRA